MQAGGGVPAYTWPRWSAGAEYGTYIAREKGHHTSPLTEIEHSRIGRRRIAGRQRRIATTTSDRSVSTVH